MQFDRDLTNCMRPGAFGSPFFSTILGNQTRGARLPNCATQAQFVLTLHSSLVLPDQRCICNYRCYYNSPCLSPVGTACL